MKVLYTIAGFYRTAGMERVLAGKAAWLDRNGHEVVIVTTEQQFRKPAYSLPEGIRLIDLGVGYENNNGASLMNKVLGLPFKKIRHRRALGRVLKQERPDVAVSLFCGDEGFMPRLAKKADARTMTILECHFSRYKRLQYERKGLWAVADKVRCNAEPRKAARYDRFVLLTRQDYLDWGSPENALVMPNARTFKPHELDIVRNSIDTDERKTVLAAGRYCHQKHFDALLTAWSMIPPAVRQGWTLRIAGQGPDREPLIRQAKELGLQNVEFGPADNMKEEYARAAIFAMSSRYEGLPMVLLEAQAASLPIVAFDCKCGPSDIVSHGKNGFLVAPGNTNGLADYLQRLMKYDTLREDMSVEARYASASFDEDMIMQRWMQVFTKTDAKEETDAAADGKSRIVVSAVSLRKGGTLTILRQVLEYLADRDDITVTALVHDRSLCWYPGIRYIEIPWATHSWPQRLWCEYVTMHRISERMAAEKGGEPVDVWLSLHDTTPRVVAKKQEVYCHTSFPFLKLRFRDFFMDPKIPTFKILTPLYYKIGAKKNSSIIVQQQWFANSLSIMMHVPSQKFRVIPPAGADAGVLVGRNVEWFDPDSPQMLSSYMKQALEAGCRTFLYASTPDCHKNFECLCKAAKNLEPQYPDMKVTLTVKGNENKYAKWLHKKWGDVNCIDFRGFMSRGQLEKAYRENECFVFPSRVETWGLPVSEYAQANPDGRILLADLPYAHSYESTSVR